MSSRVGKLTVEPRTAVPDEEWVGSGCTIREMSMSEAGLSKETVMSRSGRDSSLHQNDVQRLALLLHVPR